MSLSNVEPNEMPDASHHDEDGEAQRFLMISESFLTIRQLIKWAGIVLLAYVGVALPLKFTAGDQTIVHVAIGLFTDVKLDVILPSAIAALMFGMWHRERKTGMKAIQRERERVTKLEKQLDPERSSSRLLEHPLRSASKEDL